MKTPEEIKKGLLRCSEDGCKGCNYKEDCDMSDGFSVLAFDALAYIRQLERSWDELFEKAKRLEAERDAAVKDLGRSCATCKYFNPKCAECTTMGCFNVSGANSKWQWRGVQEVE